MRMRSCLSSVVLAAASVSFLSAAQAVDLTWDANGATPPINQDDSGTWDLTATNWYNGTTNVAWTNGSNAIFGTNTTDVSAIVPYNVSLGAAIVAQDIHLNGGSITGTGALGQTYSIDDDAGGSLQLNGNFFKASPGGNPLLHLTNSGLTLGAGNHTFVIRDTGGDALPEVRVQGTISGTGGVTLDNGFGASGYDSYGSLGFSRDNTYTGATVITKGRLGIITPAGLGATSAGTTVGALGTLAIGGGGQLVTDSMSIDEPITVTRSVYTGAGVGTGSDAGNYGTAIFTYNGTHTTTFNDFTVDSNDVRLRAETSTIVIANNIKVGPDATAPMISVTGDFAGYVQLKGNNTALTGGVTIVSAVQLDVDNDNEIGGASAPLNFTGGGTYHPVGGYATSFGSHPINAATFNGGIFVEAGKTFTITQALGTGAGGGIGLRGAGTLNLNGVINFTGGGQSFFDGGTVNVNNSMTIGSLHLRSPIINIGTGGSIINTAGYVSLGQDSTGTAGGPDIAVVNITGNGQLIQNTGDDFNVSDNPNTQATINLGGTGVLTTGGITALGKQGGATGTINQTGGTLTVNRSGNFAFVVGRDNGTGVYNLSGGTYTTNGETYVGQGFGDGTSGSGTWTQSGGTATINNWFVIGREGGKGTVDISGGTLIKKGGGNVPIGEGGNGTRTNSFTVRGTGTFDAQTGQVWVANGNETTTMNLQDSGTINVNDWFAVGRGGNGIGILNISGTSLLNDKSATAANAFSVGSGGNGTVNQTGGTVNNLSSETYLGEGGTGTWNLSGGVVNANLFDAGHTGGGSGTLNVSGTGAINATTIRIGEANSVAGAVNLSGGSIKAGTIIARNSTGAKTFSFTGGTLSVGSFSVGSGIVNTGTGILAPGGIAATGTTAIAGSYTQGSTAAMTIDLASGSNDLVTTSGAVTLDGTLNLNRVASYIPGRYQPVTIVSGTTAGIFSTINGVFVDANRSLAVTYSGGGVTVTAALPGDATIDGTVNFDDLVKLAQNYNGTAKTWSQGDFNGTGNVNFDDLVILAQHYNTSAAAGSLTGQGFSAAFAQDWALAQSLVPEPTSLSLLGLGAAAMIRRRK